LAFLFIGTTGDHAGHSLVTWAIARRLVEQGFRVGFLKPFGTRRVQADGLWWDPDAILFREILDIQEALERICPYLISAEDQRERGSQTPLQEILSLAVKAAKDKDVLIIMGADHIFLDNMSRGISDISLAAELEADFILVDRFRDKARCIYSILSASSLLKERLKGVVLNRVSPPLLQEIRDHIIPSLAKKGIPFTIALPEDPFLSFQTLGDIRDVLDGELLCGEADDLEQPVGGMTVGSSDLKGELLLFKRAYNKIILLKPDRPRREEDPTRGRRSVAGILSTGGRPPPPQLLSAAQKAGIPLILVKGDTFSVLERLGQSPPPLSPQDDAKVRRMTELMDLDNALDRLLQGTGVFSG
jgi:uncharacterized protein